MKALVSLGAILFFATSVSAKEFVVTMTGDTNFIQTLITHSKDQFQPDRAMKYGTWYEWEETTKYLTPELINGDINFTNIETVVTSNINLVTMREGPSYTFASHVNAVEHLIGVGFNLFSLANNHTYDFGTMGMVQTHRSFNALQEKYPIAHGGLSLEETYGMPTVFEVGDVSVSFAAINGVGGARPPAPRGNVPGMVHLRNDEDYGRLLDNIAASETDLKILSIHFGVERQPDVGSRHRELYRLAVDRGDVDLVIGHHPHVVQPVEIYRNAAIFYSLGNFLMFGAANMNKKGPERDFGGLGKVFFDMGGDRPVITALQMVSMQNNHFQPYPLDPEMGRERMTTLNGITQRNFSKTGVFWDIDSQGYGYKCLGGEWGPKAKGFCGP